MKISQETFSLCDTHHLRGLCPIYKYFLSLWPGRVAQSVGNLTRTFVSPSAFSRRAVVSYWRKYVQEVLVNRLGGLSLPRKSVVRLIDRPDMTLDVYRGRKTTIQQQLSFLVFFPSYS